MREARCSLAQLAYNWYLARSGDYFITHSFVVTCLPINGRCPEKGAEPDGRIFLRIRQSTPINDHRPPSTPVDSGWNGCCTLRQPPASGTIAERWDRGIPAGIHTVNTVTSRGLLDRGESYPSVFSRRSHAAGYPLFSRRQPLSVRQSHGHFPYIQGPVPSRFCANVPISYTSWKNCHHFWRN